MRFLSCLVVFFVISSPFSIMSGSTLTVKLLRLERSGRKQSHGFWIFLLFIPNDNYSTGHDLISIFIINVQILILTFNDFF